MVDVLLQVPEMATSEHAVNYMYHVFHNIFGMEVIDQVIIEGHNAMIPNSIPII